MSKKMNIDELFKQKLGHNRQVDFDAGAWDKMETLLNKEMPVDVSPIANSSASFWSKKWLIAASVTGVVGIGAATWWLTNASKVETNFAQNPAKPNVEQSIEEISTEKAPSSTIESSNEIAQTQNQTSTVEESVDNNSFTSEMNSNRSDQQFSTETTTSKSSNASSTNQPLDDNLVALQEIEGVNTITAQNQVDLENNNLSPLTQNSSLVSKESLATETTDLNNEDIANLQKANSITPKELANLSWEEALALFGDEKTPIVSEEISSNKNENALQMKVQNNELQPQQLQTNSTAEDVQLTLPKVNRKTLFVLAGANLAQSQKENESNSFSGNEFVGVGFDYLLKGRFSVAANLIYQPRYGVDATKNFTAVNYNFGKQETTTTVSAKRLYYLELPVYASFHAGRHTISAGPSVSYLLNANNDVQITTTNAFGDDTQTSDQEMGHTEGLNRWDIAVAAGYEIKVFEKLSLGARASYGLTDVTNNDYYQSNTDHRNLMFRFMLKYDIVEL